MNDAAALRAPIRHRGTLHLERTVSLGAQAAAALALRGLREKEAFTLVDTEGTAFRASITSLGKAGAEALVYERMALSPEPPVALTLIVGVLARQRMLGVLQKATELGVACIVPVITARSVQADGLDHEKVHAWPAQVLRACKQSRRASVPELCSARPIAAVLDTLGTAPRARRFVLDDRPHAPADGAPQASEQDHGVVLAVGPEGGFDDAERAAFGAHGFEGVRLGGRILRAETAVLVGLTLLQRSFGDYRSL